MKKLSYLLLAFFALGLVFQACDDTETYAEKKEKERRWISNYISANNIKVIRENEFYANDTTTDVSRNEYVYFDDSGVYMQILKRGDGELMRNGERAEFLLRFVEVLVETGDTLSTSNLIGTNSYDVMMCSKSSGEFTASFTEGNMASNYGQSVPTGWLVPLNYIKPAVQLPNEDLARVRVIVPHSAGHQTASSYVAPYYYEITYQKKR